MDEKLTKWTKVLVLACAALVATAGCGPPPDAYSVKLEYEEHHETVKAEGERMDAARMLPGLAMRTVEPNERLAAWLDECALLEPASAEALEDMEKLLLALERGHVEPERFQRRWPELDKPREALYDCWRGLLESADFKRYKAEVDSVAESVKRYAVDVTRLLVRFDSIMDSRPGFFDDCPDEPTDDTPFFEAFAYMLDLDADNKAYFAALDTRDEAERLLEAGHVEAARTKAAEAVRLADVYAARERRGGCTGGGGAR